MPVDGESGSDAVGAFNVIYLKDVKNLKSSKRPAGKRHSCKDDLSSEPLSDKAGELVSYRTFQEKRSCTASSLFRIYSHRYDDRYEMRFRDYVSEKITKYGHAKPADVFASVYIGARILDHIDRLFLGEPRNHEDLRSSEQLVLDRIWPDSMLVKGLLWGEHELKLLRTYAQLEVPGFFSRPHFFSGRCITAGGCIDEILSVSFSCSYQDKLEKLGLAGDYVRENAAGPDTDRQ